MPDIIHWSGRSVSGDYLLTFHLCVFLKRKYIAKRWVIELFALPLQPLSPLTRANNYRFLEAKLFLPIPSVCIRLAKNDTESQTSLVERTIYLKRKNFNQNKQTSTLSNDFQKGFTVPGPIGSVWSAIKTQTIVLRVACLRVWRPLDGVGVYVACPFACALWACVFLCLVVLCPLLPSVMIGRESTSTHCTGNCLER